MSRLQYSHQFSPDGDYFDETDDEYPNQMGESVATMRPDESYYTTNDTMSEMNLSAASSVGLRSFLSSSSQQPSNPYGGTSTSDTSFREQDLPFSPNDPPPLDTTHAPREQDFSHMGDFAADANLNNLPRGGILPEIEPPREAAASHHTGKQATSERKGVPGLPSNDTHRRRSGANDYIAAAGEITNFVNMWAQGHPHSTQQISQMNEALSLVAECTRKDFPRGPESTINNGGCMLCGTMGLNKGVLKRHLTDKHHPQYVYSCPKPGCKKTQRRKDKIQAHIRTHPGFESMSYERIELPPPAQCSVCSLNTTSWDAFYSCVLSHHQTGGTQSERAASQNNDKDHGKVTRIDSTQGNQSQKLTVPSSNPRRNRSNSSGRAAQGNSSTPRRLTHHTSFQPPRGSQPYPQRIQRPELPRGRRSSQREPSSRDTRRPEPRCAVCGHVFRACPLENCRSRTSPCHECVSRSMGSSGIPRVAQGSSQSQSPLEMGVPPLATVFSTDPSWNSGPIPSGQEMQAFTIGQFDPPESQDLRSLDRAFLNEDLSGSSSQGNTVYFPNLNLDVWTARQINSPTLSEEELCSPSPLASKLSPAGVSVNAFPWSKTLPIGIPNKPCKDLSTLPITPISCPYSGIGVSEWKEIPPPRLSQCKCACNTLPKKAESKIATNLPNGRSFEIKFSVAPPSPGSTFRNKVQIVIKLLNLRGATKKKAEAKNALEAPAGTKDGSDEDDAADDDTGDGNEEDIPDDKPLANVPTCTDTSLYEDQLPVPWYQQMEFTFDVELQSSFDRISQLTGALASDDWNVTYDKEPMEMKCPFDYLLRYIMFMIAVMARAADLGLVHN